MDLLVYTSHYTTKLSYIISYLFPCDRELPRRLSGIKEMGEGGSYEVNISPRKALSFAINGGLYSVLAEG